MKKTFSLSLFVILVVCLSLVMTGLAQAQSGNTLTVSLRRDFGYGGGANIQGVFTITASGPADLTRVVFLIDGQTMAEVTQPPFKLQFDTSQYPNTKHILSAKGYTSTGAELTSNEITAVFLSKSEAGAATTKIVVPLVGIILLVTLIGILGPMVLKRGKLDHLPLGAQRKYGVEGGTICPRCSRPYARPFFAPNLLFGKLTRCPYCGKVAITRAYPLEVLRQAEADELKNAPGDEQIAPESEEEKLRKEIENSRYVG